MTDPEKAQENAGSIPILFPDNEYSQKAFTVIGEALLVNPELFKKPALNEIRESLERVIGTLNLINGNIYRGDDFAPDFPDDDALKWLYSEEHFYLGSLGVRPRKSKAGRLGGVIAMYPRRDEIADLVTRELVQSWAHDVPPAFLSHVSRLLTHTNAPACDDFVIEFLKHPEFWETIPENLDGNSAFVCWTYAPYVLKHLKEAGRSFEDLMGQWVKKRRPINDSNAKYPGVEYMYEKMSTMHYLQKDGHSPSHKFVDFIAEKAILPQL